MTPEGEYDMRIDHEGFILLYPVGDLNKPASVRERSMENMPAVPVSNFLCAVARAQGGNTVSIIVCKSRLA